MDIFSMDWDNTQMEFYNDYDFVTPSFAATKDTTEKEHFEGTTIGDKLHNIWTGDDRKTVQHTETQRREERPTRSDDYNDENTYSYEKRSRDNNGDKVEVKKSHRRN